MSSLAPYVHDITYRPKERINIFRNLSLAEQSVVLVALSPYIQQQVLLALPIEEVVNVLDHLDLQTAESIVKRIRDTSRRMKVVKLLKQDIKEKIDHFIQFHPKATASLVHLNYLYVPHTATVGEVGDEIEEHHLETGRFPEILVHKEGVFFGFVPMTVLVRERNSAKVGDYAEKIATIPYRAKTHEIHNLCLTSGDKKFVVLDEDGSVLGILYADDVRDLIGDLPLESLYAVAGLDQGEKPFDSAYSKFKNRRKWLVVNLMTAFFAGSVILIFKDTIDRLAILAVYIPIVAGMGGNAASQTFAVIMRGITLGSISYKDGLPAILNEVKAGVLNGLLIGAIVAVVSVLVNHSFLLGVVVALAMITVHVVAGLFASLIPLYIKKMRKDPATMSMIFITTTTDVAGMLSLLGFGALLLL